MVHYNKPTQQVKQEDAKHVEIEEITIPSHNYGKGVNKQERVECLKCHKPAVRYMGNPGPNGRMSISYEHRDEPPVAYYKYKNRTVARYRRCWAGSSIDASKVIEEAAKEEQEPEPSDTIRDVLQPQPQPQQPVLAKKINYREPLPKGRRPSGAEIYKILRAMRNEQQRLHEDQDKIHRELHAIRSIMEMLIAGDLTLLPKAMVTDPTKTSGIG